MSVRLAGVIQEPVAPEVVAVEPVHWNMIRPTDYEVISENVTNIYHTESAGVALMVILYEYEEDCWSWPFEGGDGLMVGVMATANVSEGFVHTLVVRFSLQASNATVFIYENPDSIVLQNTRPANLQDGWAVDEPYAEFTPDSQQPHCGAMFQAAWVFLDQNNNLDHAMTLMLETTYSDGTTYWKIELPVQLGVPAS